MALATAGAALVAALAACGSTDHLLVGGWTCSTRGPDGARLEQRDLPFPSGGFRIPGSGRRTCEKTVEVGEETVVATGFAGRQPHGVISVSLAGRVMVDQHTALRGGIIHAVPPGLRGPQRLQVQFERSPDGGLLNTGTPSTWRLGPRAEVEAAIGQELIPDLTLSLLLVLVGAAFAPAALALRRRSPDEAVLLGAFAGFGLLIGAIRLIDNPLHPLIGLPRLGLIDFRYPLGMVAAWLPLEACRRLARPAGERWLAWLWVPFLLSALARALTGSLTVLVVTNTIAFSCTLPVLGLCLHGLLRRRPVDLLAVAGIGLLLVGVGSRLLLLSSRPGTPDYQLLTMTLVFGLLATAALRRVGDRVKQLTHLEALARYVPSQLIAHAARGEPLTGGHRRRRVTVFFSDVSGFTALSDELEPEILAEVIGRYLTRMAAIAEQHGGVIDKFVGDAVMVWFGGLGEGDETGNARQCVRMALGMLRSLPALNAELASLGLPRPLAIRIGINTGFATIGDFGSAQRADFTAVGREVNLAARLESTGVVGQIQVGPATRALVTEAFACVPRGPIQPKGFHNPVETWLISPDDRHADEAEEKRKESAGRSVLGSSQ